MCVAFSLRLTNAALRAAPSLPAQALVMLAIGATVGVLFYVVLIYFVSSGQRWARLIYALLLGVQTVIVVQAPSAVWLDSKVLIGMGVVSLVCDYMAVCWPFFRSQRICAAACT